MATRNPTLTEEELFDSALRLTDPAERAAFLEATCGGDVALRTRVETLLAAHEESHEFFEEGASLFTISSTIGELRSKLRDGLDVDRPDPEPEEAVGQWIGRYKLLERIGVGGCGVVYLAGQEKPVRRHVALKIIRGGMQTKGVIARFEAERQALAMMDHPNIARVFDAGETDSGLPYFVMEHVRGVRLTDYCNRRHLSLEDRLRLFIQVCHAIQHAHQNCIVHGDIKPSNILVAQHDGIPVPKVIDFGISKAIENRRPERHPHVSVAQLVGTPAYMSPEQVEYGGLEIDTRSDIYSLGVLLYELLCEKTPIDSAGLEEAGMEKIRDLFREHRTQPPSERAHAMDPGEREAVAGRRGLSPKRLNRHLQDDLDCIVMKALQPDRRLRYETANAIARDIERHLHTEPVMAHPRNWLYRTSKLIRRNRGAVLAGGAVAIALVAGTATSTWLFLKERDARQRAVAAEQQQARLREEAEVREQITQAALMVSLGRLEEADRLVRDIVLNESTLEGAAVFRSLGEWHAINGRWEAAADRFQVLLRINHLEGPDVSSLDYLELGPVLLEVGDMAAFEEFRQEAINRFSSRQNPFSDRIMKISLLHPAGEDILAQIEPLAESNEQAIEEARAAGDAFVVAWRSMSMALYEYRRGNFEAAVGWGRQCLNSPDTNAPRAAAVRSILAMAHLKLGHTGEARGQLAQVRGLLENRQTAPFDRGSPVNGFWFDWAFARILSREALSLPE